MSSNFAGRDDFFAAAARRFKEVPLPGGKTARIQSITAGEWADIDARNVDMKKGGLSATGLRNSDLRLVVAAVVDADGQKVFSEADMPKLAALDAGVIVPLVKAIKEHSGLRQDVEDTLKNLSGTDGGCSPASS